MKTLFNGVALLIGVTCLVWVAVLWHWQATSRDMSVEDIVLYLVVLPVVAITLILMVRWAWRGVVARQAAAAATAAGAGAAGGSTSSSSSSSSATADAGAAGDAALRHVAHPVWMAALHTAAGATPDELLNAAKTSDPRPALDADLTDEDGLPLMCARIADLAVDELQAALAPVMLAVAARLPPGDGPAPTELDDGVLRALSALQAPLEAADRALRLWQPLFMQAEDPPTLHVVLGLPGTWAPFEQHVALDWLKLALAAAENPPLPAARLSITLHTEGGETLWLKADQILMMLAQQKRQGLVLVLAAHSDLSELAVARLAQAGRLFHPQHNPKGHMPGEAAAAVLLASAQWPLLPPDADDPDLAPLAWVHRPALARRGKSIEAAGKVDAGTLTTVMDQARQASRIDAAELAALVCDADQHTARGTELFGTTLDLLPQLEPTEHMCLTGTVCAGAGAATALTVVAAACAHARALEQAVLAATLGDPFMRLSLVVRHGDPSGPSVRPHNP